MAWEHQVARAFRARDNKPRQPWVLGQVLSPKKVPSKEDPRGYELIGPLIISAYNGNVILRSDMLKVLASVGELYAPMEVALTGDQHFVVLGVLA